MERVIELFNVEKTFAAEKALQELISSIQANLANETDEQRRTLLEQELKDVEGHAVSKQIVTDARDIREVIEAVEDKEGWILQKETKNCRICYRNVPGTPVHSLMIDGVMDVDIFSILAVVNETDLFSNWVPHLKVSQRLAQPGRCRQLAHFEVGLPWPVANRETVIYAYGSDVFEEHGFIAIRTRTQHSIDGITFAPGYELGKELLNTGLPPKKPSNVEVIIHMTGMIVQPIEEKKTRLVVIAHSDPQLAIVPYWLVNCVTRQFAYKIFERMEKLAKNVPGSEYEKRINENTALYGFVRERVQQIFSTIPREADNAAGTEIVASEEDADKAPVPQQPEEKREEEGPADGDYEDTEEHERKMAQAAL